MNDKLEPVCCGCGGEAKVISYLSREYCKMAYYVRCIECGTETDDLHSEAEAVTAWNRAMGAEKNSIVSVFSSEPIAKDINIPNKATVIIEPFTTDMNHVGYCKCGYLVNAEWKYCPNCGASLEWQ